MVVASADGKSQDATRNKFTSRYLSGGLAHFQSITPMIAKYRRNVTDIVVSAQEIEAVVSGFGCYRIWYTKDANYVSFDKWSGKFELRDGRNRIVSVHRSLQEAIAAAPLMQPPHEIDAG